MKAMIRLLMTCALVVGLTGTATAQEENAELELVHWPLYIGATDGPDGTRGVTPTAFFGRITGLLPNADYYFGPTGGAYGFIKEGTTATRGSRWNPDTGQWQSPSTAGFAGTSDADGVLERWFFIRPPSDFPYADQDNEDFRVRIRIFRAGMDGHLQFDNDSPADLVALQVHADAPSGYEGAWIVGDVGTDFEGYVAVVYENVTDDRPLNAWLVQNHDIGQEGDRGGNIDDAEEGRTAGRFITFVPPNTNIGRIEIRDEVTGELIGGQNSTEWRSGDAGSVTFLADLDAFAVSIDQIGTEIPAGFMLSQNFPNPFNPQTRIEFSIPQSQQVHLAVYNLLGQQVATLVNGVVSAGSHAVSWDGRSASGQVLPSGVYIYQMRAGNVVQSKTMTFIK
jgi:hypothetical protein